MRTQRGGGSSRSRKRYAALPRIPGRKSLSMRALYVTDTRQCHMSGAGRPAPLMTYRPVRYGVRLTMKIP